MATTTSPGGDHTFRTPQEPSEVRPSYWARIRQHRWKVALCIGLLLAAAAGAMVVFTDTPTYEASALLMIEGASPFVAYSPRDTGNQPQRYLQTQMELLRSPIVLVPVLSRSEIAALSELSDQHDPLEYLRDHISIKQVGSSELYALTYVSRSPQAAASVPNAIVAEYMNIHSSDEFARSQRVIDILEEERRRRALEVERLRRRVLDLSIEAMGRDPFNGEDVHDIENENSPLISLRERLLDVDVEREAVEAELRYLKEKQVPPEEDVESPTVHYPYRSLLVCFFIVLL